MEEEEEERRGRVLGGRGRKEDRSGLEEKMGEEERMRIDGRGGRRTEDTK